MSDTVAEDAGAPDTEPATGRVGEDPSAPDPERRTGRPPLYPRLLRLQHVHPNAWQRAVLGEGMAGVGLLLAMADLASAWSVVVLPVAVAGLVKAHDLLAGLLAEQARVPSDQAAPEHRP